MEICNLTLYIQRERDKTRQDYFIVRERERRYTITEIRLNFISPADDRRLYLEAAYLKSKILDDPNSTQIRQIYL